MDMSSHAGTPPASPSYLCGLNESQADAVRTTEGPLLVLAGAGTGKTRVLTTRMAHILASGLAQPWQVLAVTFTNKAAREMRERVAALLDRSVESWWVGTFHATGARMLRGHAELLGLKPAFGILDTDDQLRVIKQLAEARRIDTRKLPPRLFASVIQRWKDRGLTPERVTPAEGADAVDGLALPLYGDYQDRLRALDACDFGDLLLHALALFRDHPEVAERYRQQFHYILVDEYQDTNVAQYLWLRALAQGHHNVCCVGDDDQSIYSWRGAEIGNILRFERDFPGARIIRLECNYRSTSHILAAASELIAHNRGRLGKTLWTTAAGGDKVAVRATWDGEDEARVVGSEIEALQVQGHPLRQMAVLVRAGFQTREFEERLITIGIPYRVIGGARFYERQEIRDAVAYFRIVVRPDDDLAFERIVNTPKRGLGLASLRSIHQLARGANLPLSAAAARLVASDELKTQARTALARLLADIARWRDMLARTAHPAVARAILDESGYTGMWQADRSPEAAGRLENLKELVVALAEFESLPGFLEHVSLVMDNDEAAGDEKVALMTLHAAKGLEFDTVFLPGWEEGIFPNQRALDEGGTAALEEERRLAYVGLTRARRRAIVSYAASRMVFGTWQNTLPSRFVKELPAANVEQSAPTGLFAARPFRGASDGFARDGFQPDASASSAEPVRLAAEAGGRWPQRRPAPPTIDGRAERTTTRPQPAHPFTVGQRVFHQKFGYGQVRTVDGDRLEIDFEKAGAKTVIHSFVAAA